MGGVMRFSSQGYQIFRGVYKAIEIEYARQAVERICRDIRPGDALWERNITPISSLEIPRNPGLRKDAIPSTPFLIGVLPLFSTVLKAFVLHPPLWEIAKDILGSGEIVYHFSNVTRKPAYVGPSITWHRDYPNRYICPKKSRDFFRALIPLEGMNRGSGCTEVVPKSHEITDEEAIQEEKKRDFDLCRSVPLEVEAGDLVIIHPKLLHGGKENRSGRERNLVVIQFGLKTDAFLYWNEELFTGATRDGILENAEI